MKALTARLASLTLALALPLAAGCSGNNPADGGTPDVPGTDAPTDTPALDSGSTDDAAVDAADARDATDTIDAPDAPDAPDAIDAPDAPDVTDDATTGTPDVTEVDAPIDVTPPADASTPGTLRFDAPVEWTQLPPGYSIARDVNGDGVRDALSIDAYNPVGQAQITFALAQTDGTFVPATTFTVPGYYVHLDYGDFDADGDTDVLARAQSASTPNSYVALGRGDGTFAALETLTFQADFVADLDHDGRSDLLERSGSTSAVLHFRQAAGGWTSRSLTTASGAISAGDFDGDGTMDLAAGATVYRGTGSGNFGTGLAAACTGCPTADRALVGRFNADARDDLLIADSGHLAILLGQPDGSLAVASVHALSHLVKLTTGDLDRDGRLDVVAVAEPIAVTSDDQLELFYGDGTGGVTERRSYQNTRPNLAALDVLDADRDGRNDVVLEGRFVAYGRGDRRIRAPELSAFPVPFGTRTAQVAPLDGPGPLDVIVPTTTAEIDTWRFDADRRLGAMQTCNGPGTTQYRAVRDITGDGVPDVYSSASGTLSVWVGAGGCTFSAEHRSALGTYLNVFVPVDTDRLPDLVFLASNGIGVSLATAPGDFGTPVVTPFTGSIEGLVAGDWNRDGMIDALVVDNTAHKITALVGDASHQFTPGQVVMVASTDQVWYPTVADVDTDGDADVLFANGRTGQLEVLWNDGAGTFTRVTLTAIDAVTQFDVGDVDNDGRVEVLAADNQLFTSVWRFDATGATRLTRLALPRSAFLRDADGDGDLDLVYVDTYDAAGFVGIAANLLIKR